jgi:histidine ammonia-lyase
VEARIVSFNRPPVVICRPADLTLEVIEQIAWGGRRLVLSPELLAEIGAARAAVERALQNGAEVYGVTTGMGYLSTVRLDDAERARQSSQLFLGRAVGGPPFLDREETRALLLARLAGFLDGHAGVTPALCSFIADRLNDNFLPAVPRTDAGSAGEIIPLSHAFGAFLGLGEVLAGATAEPAAEALQARGVAPYEPAPKEGIALLAGAPGVLALTVARRRDACTLARQLTVCWACAIDALGAPLGPYEPSLGTLAGDPILQGVLERLAVLLEGARAERTVTQAPVSFRVIPQVLTHIHRVLDRTAEDSRRALGAVMDSPAFHEGRFISTGAFHELGLAAQLDSLGVALVHAAELCAQHIHRLLDHRFSGLPDQLTGSPGSQAGLVVVHKRAVGAVHRLRTIATPSTIGLADTSLGQEDAMTFGFEAAEKLRTVEGTLRDVIACELLVCRQAWWLRSTPPAAGLRGHAAELGRVIEPIAGDRQLGREIDALAGHISGGAFQ